MIKSWFSTDRAGVIPVVLAGVLAALLAAPAIADETYTPWPGEFMRMGAGARALAMGNAYSAIEGDVYSSYFNPAGLAAMEGKQLAFSIRYLPFDRKFLHLAYGARIGPDADFAFSWIQSGTDDIIGRDLSGNPTGSLEDKRNMLGLTFSKDLSQRISVGINTKLTLWKLGDDDARTFGFDIGLIARPFRHLTCSVVVRDFNSRFTWKADSWSQRISGADGNAVEKVDDFPLYYTAGAAYELYDDQLLLSVTAESIEDNPVSYNAGIAFELTPRFILRGGMYHYTAEDGLDMGAYTGGLSLVLTDRTQFDYAYVPEDFTGDPVHSISFTLNYGE